MHLTGAEFARCAVSSDRPDGARQPDGFAVGLLWSPQHIGFSSRSPVSMIWKRALYAR